MDFSDTDATVLVTPPESPQILNSSPAINVPDVSDNVIVVLLPPALAANPDAPLDNPSTNPVVGNSVLVNALLTVNVVKVCMSNK